MSTKTTVPFNYDELYASVMQRFKDEGYDIQEGSNTMQIASAMAYLVSMLNVNTAVNINETLLTLARKRKSVLQDSRVLGYEPGNKISYQYNLTLKFTPEKDENNNFKPTSFTVPKYAMFTSGSKKYYYFGDIIRLRDIIEVTEINILVKEGNLLKSETTPELSFNIGVTTDSTGTKVQNYLDIPFTDVEDDGIDCFLTFTDSITGLITKELWSKFDKFQIDSDTILNKQFYRLNIIEYDFPRIYLKLPHTGKDLNVGTKIDLNILITSGVNGEMTSIPTTSDVVCEIIDFKLKLQGTSEETIDSIKYNAPLFYNSANRAVTKNDYISICNRLTSINKTFVWDGNDEFPQKAGIVWFSFLPQTNVREFSSDAFKSLYKLNNPFDKINWFLEDSEISGSSESVFTKLNKFKIPTLSLLHRHPVYMDFFLTVEILKYDITKSESKQNNIVFDIINSYFNTPNDKTSLENFESEFFLSNLIKRIDNELSDITGVNITVKNKIQFNTKYIVNELFDNNIKTKKILIPLGLPYSDLLTSKGYIRKDKFPNIDTDKFLNNKDIRVDFDAISGIQFSKDIEIIEADINLCETIVVNNIEETLINKIGTYRLQRDNLITLEFNIGEVLKEELIDSCVLNVSYENNNIKFTKNCLPRLNTVDFI